MAEFPEGNELQAKVYKQLYPVALEDYYYLGWGEESMQVGVGRGVGQRERERD